MTPSEHVYRTLFKTGVPGALQAFPEAKADGTGGAPPTPFFVYMEDRGGEFFADDVSYASVPTFRCELYESSRDAALESRFSEAIASAYGPCSVLEDWVESEHARMVTYTFAFTPAAGQGAENRH